MIGVGTPRSLQAGLRGGRRATPANMPSRDARLIIGIILVAAIALGVQKAGIRDEVRGLRADIRDLQADLRALDEPPDDGDRQSAGGGGRAVPRP